MTSEYIDHDPNPCDPLWTTDNDSASASQEAITEALSALCGDDAELISLVRRKCGYADQMMD